MDVKLFDFDLPSELIAQTPIIDRSSSRLLVVDNDNQVLHKQFLDVVDLLDAGDVLVLNNTRVIPARLIGNKVNTGAKIELLLLQEEGQNIWKSLVKPAKRIKIGDQIDFGGLLTATCVERFDTGIMNFEMTYDGIFLEVLDKLGTMPLPPYITESLPDQERYQTVYSKTPGSVAAPTAGLHFTTDLLEQIKAKGIEINYITLHVGLGTFRPISVDNTDDHQMHDERYEISSEVADNLNKAKSQGRRIIAVGTTSVRTLEANICKHGKFVAENSSTEIFISPGYEFKAVDSIITNFHLPKSTLVMLISAFTSRELTMSVYQEAIDMRYRFFSFGDSMFINYKK